MTLAKLHPGRPKLHFFEDMEPGDVWFYPQKDTSIRHLQKNLSCIANRNKGVYRTHIKRGGEVVGVEVRRVV